MVRGQSQVSGVSDRFLWPALRPAERRPHCGLLPLNPATPEASMNRGHEGAAYTNFRNLVLIILGLCCLLRAEDRAPQKVQVTNTERSDFPSGGTLHLKNSIGELAIEGWDQAGMEMTTIKSSKVAVEGQEREKATKLLDNVKVTTERKGDDVTISTAFPKHGKLARLFVGMTDFDLEYHIKIPRNARLVIDHDAGEVHIDGVMGEVHATDHMGLITVREPDGQYAIDAVSKLGAVESDFPGNERGTKFFGHAFLSGTGAEPSAGPKSSAGPAATGSAAPPKSASASTSAQKMFLRIKYGDIIILLMHQPPPPAPVVPSGK
jgi:hypothetical protein